MNTLYFILFTYFNIFRLMHASLSVGPPVLIKSDLTTIIPLLPTLGHCIVCSLFAGLDAFFYVHSFYFILVAHKPMKESSDNRKGIYLKFLWILLCLQCYFQGHNWVIFRWGRRHIYNRKDEIIHGLKIVAPLFRDMSLTKAWNAGGGAPSSSFAPGNFSMHLPMILSLLASFYWKACFCLPARNFIV